MANTTANPFAAMVEPGLFAQAVAVSLQLNLLPKRQYSPLNEPPRIGGPECSAIGDDDEAKGQDGADAADAVAAIATVAALPLHGCWLGAVDDAARFDFVDTGPGGFIAVDPVRRVG